MDGWMDIWDFHEFPSKGVRLGVYWSGMMFCHVKSNTECISGSTADSTLFCPNVFYRVKEMFRLAQLTTHLRLGFYDVWAA